MTAEPGQDVNMLLLPKFLGILPFDQANKGAQEAATELQNPTAFNFTGPTARTACRPDRDVTNAPTQGFKVVMISNNAGDRRPAADAAQEAGTKVVTWDSPIPSAEGERRLRRTGRLQRDRQGDGGDGAWILGRRRRQGADPLGVAGRRQPERLERA